LAESNLSSYDVDRISAFPPARCTTFELMLQSRSILVALEQTHLSLSP